MPKAKKVRSVLADVDGIVRILTGRSIAQMAQKAMDTWSEEMARRMMAPEEPPDALKEAYDILGVSPACSDRILRAAYRAAAKDTHPDAGGSDEAFKRLDEAMNKICEARGIKK